MIPPVILSSAHLRFCSQVLRANGQWSGAAEVRWLPGMLHSSYCKGGQQKWGGLGNTPRSTVFSFLSDLSFLQVNPPQSLRNEHHKAAQPKPIFILPDAASWKSPDALGFRQTSELKQLAHHLGEPYWPNWRGSALLSVLLPDQNTCWSRGTCSFVRKRLWNMSPVTQSTAQIEQ